MIRQAPEGFVLTAILPLLAQAALPTASVDVRTEDSVLLPFSGPVLYNNVYGKGDITNCRQQDLPWT
jgi:hypothetical protein